RRVPAREHGVEAVRALLHARKAREQPRAFDAPEIEEELVAGEAREERDRHHRAEIEIAAIRREPGEREDRLALEERADEDRQVPVRVDQARKIDAHATEGWEARGAAAPPRSSARRCRSRGDCRTWCRSARGP